LLYAESVQLPTLVATLLEVALDETLLLLVELSTGACVAFCFALLIAAATSLLALAGACATVTVLELSAETTSLLEDTIVVSELEVAFFAVVFFFLLELVLDDEVVVLMLFDWCPRTVKLTINRTTMITNAIIKFRFL